MSFGLGSFLYLFLLNESLLSVNVLITLEQLAFKGNAGMSGSCCYIKAMDQGLYCVIWVYSELPNNLWGAQTGLWCESVSSFMCNFIVTL